MNLLHKYAKESLEIWDNKTFEVYDPWTAQIRGVFYTREDAEAFKAMIQFMAVIEAGTDNAVGDK